jgi:hypothetical protein
MTTPNGPWTGSFPNFSFFTRYRTNISYPAFSNCSFNENPGNGNPSEGATIGTINGHLDWNDDIVDTTDLWEATLFVRDLATTLGTLKAPDSGYTDVTLRRLQVFGISGSHGAIVWKNQKGNTVIQQGSLDYNAGPITIPAVKVFKTSSRLKVTYPATGVEKEFTCPGQYNLSQNYPNPFNPTTVLSCQSPVASHVRIAVYDILGREVAVLMDEKKEAGRYEVKWDASGFASGVYICRMAAERFVDCKRMVLIK